MKKSIIKLLLLVSLILCFGGLGIPAYAEQRYTDVPESFWAYDQINYVYDKNMISGYPDGSFRPNEFITRAETATVLVKYLGLEVVPVATTSFTDVYPSDWYAPYVEAGKGMFPQWIAFNGDTPFTPNNPATREDITYAIVTALGYSTELDVVDQSVLNMFSDADSISRICKPYVAFAVQENLVSGYDNGTFCGQQPLTRAEFAAMMYKAAKHGVNPDVNSNVLRTYVTGEILPTYDTSITCTRYAGNGTRDHADNTDLLEASFVEPASITADEEDNVVYIADSGVIRKITSSGVESFNFSPSYITPDIMEVYNDDLYFVSNIFENDDGSRYYAVIKLNDSGVEAIYGTQASYTTVTDISIDDGIMYMLQYNSGYEKNYICSLNLETKEFTVLKDVAEGFKSLDVYDGYAYIVNQDESYISRYNFSNGDTEHYCGTVNESRIVDGSATNTVKLFDPRKIICRNGYMYVLDYNMLRKIEIKDTNWAVKSTTIAGAFTADKTPKIAADYFTASMHPASDITFTPSYMMDFCFISNYDILLTDPKKSMIWLIKLAE